VISSSDDLLRDRALRCTQRRLRILEALRLATRPLTARELHGQLGGESIDLATVYRTLERFVEASLAHRLRLGDSAARYEIVEPNHHHHLVCTSCGAVEALADCRVGPLEDLALREHGFHVVRHSLEFFGTCHECTPNPR
jgi:Fur family transcriptional regulator, ferric uptake regulator